MKDLAEGFKLFQQLVETLPGLPTNKKNLADYKETELTFVTGSTENPLLHLPERIFLPQILHPSIDPTTQEIIKMQDLQVAFLYYYQVNHPAPRDLEWVAEMLVQPVNAGMLEARAVFFLAQRSIPIRKESYETRQTVKALRFSAPNFQVGHFIAHDIEQRSPLQLVKLSYGLVTIYASGIKENKVT